MAYDNNEKKYENGEQKMETIYSKRIRAGKRRTYFFDVRTTRANDYYLTITESRKRFNDNGYDRHKVFLYKEDFNKFVKALSEAVDYVKTDLMPDFDFDAFNHDEAENENQNDSQIENQTDRENENQPGSPKQDENTSGLINGVLAAPVVIETELEASKVVTTTPNVTAEEDVDKW